MAACYIVGAKQSSRAESDEVVMNNIIENATRQRKSLTLPTRNLVRFDVTHRGPSLTVLGERKTTQRIWKLKDVERMLVQLEKKQEAKDIHAQSNRLQLEIKDGKAFGRILSRDNVSERMPFTKTGLNSLFKNTKKGMSLNTIDKHWSTNERGDNIVSALYAHLVMDSESPLMIRTVNRGNERVIRSVHPAGHHGCYQPYSHLDLVKNFIDGAEEYAEATVLSCILNDDGIRVKLAAPDHVDGLVVHQSINKIEAHNPVNVFQLRNSETGEGSLGLSGGIWTLICTNGMTSYQGEFNKRTPHRGKPERLASWFSGATEDMLTKNYGVLQRYEEALDTYVDDLFAFTKYTFEQAAKNGRHKLPTSIVDEVIDTGLRHATTPQNHSVAQVSQAIALIAQQHDFAGEALLEEIALDTLNRGLGLAHEGRVVVPAKA